MTLAKCLALKINGASPIAVDLASGNLIILDYAAIVAVGDHWASSPTAFFNPAVGLVTS